MNTLHHQNRRLWISSVRCGTLAVALWTAGPFCSTLFAGPRSSGKTPNRLIGTWRIVSAVNDGSRVEAERIAGGTLKIERNGSFAIRFSPEAGRPKGDAGEVKVGRSGKLPTADFLSNRQPKPDNVLHCIYKMENGRLTLCGHLSRRPTQFRSEPGSGNQLTVFVRGH